MHIITQRRIQEAKRQYPNDASNLEAWYRVMKRAEVNGFAELRNLFPSVDRVKDFHVFNIGGRNLRIIAVIHYNRQKCYIREVLTHAQYDRWKP